MKHLDQRERLESLLRGYPQLVSEINVMLCKYAEIYSLPAVRFHDKAKIGKTNVTYSDVEAYVVRLLDHDTALQGMISRRNLIAAALQCLTDREYDVIEKYYFRGWPLEKIGKDHNVDRHKTTVAKIKDAALDKVLGTRLLDPLENTDANKTHTKYYQNAT